MTLEREAFTTTRLEEEKIKDKGVTIGVWFNSEEIALIERFAPRLHQAKQATVIKQLMLLGAKLLDDPLVRAANDVLFNNVRKDVRLKPSEIELKIRKS